MKAIDRDRLDSIYRTHGHAVLRRARRMLGTEDDAREILHEVFLSLVEEPGS